MLKVMLDTNILLDSILERKPWEDMADALLREGRSRKHMQAFVTAPSLNDVYFIVSRNRDADTARTFLRYVLECCDVLPVGASACTAALSEGFPEPDFEDGLIAAAAVEGRMDLIISRDEDAFNNLPVMKIHPQLFTAFFMSQTPYPKQAGEHRAAVNARE